MIRLSITPRQAEIILSLLEFSIEEMEMMLDNENRTLPLSAIESKILNSDIVSVKTLKSQILKKTSKI